MELRRYTDVLNRRKWVILLTIVAALAVAGVGSYLMTPVYSASALVRVVQNPNTDASRFDLNYAERLMNTYARLLKSRPLIDEVKQRLSLTIPTGQLAQQVGVETVVNTELLRITAGSTEPQQAADIANTLAALLIEQGQEAYFGQTKSAREILQEQMGVVENTLRDDRAALQDLQNDTSAPDRESAIRNLEIKIRIGEQTYSTLLNQYEQARIDEAMRENSIMVVEPATAPGAPSEPNMRLNLLLGALVGLVGGIALALLLENLDPAIHSLEDLEEVSAAPVLGWIPNLPVPRRARHGAILLNGNGQSPAGEAFRTLGLNILSLVRGQPPKTLLVTSVEPDAGKSTVVANLAVTIAQSGLKVTVVDSDLRAASLHRVFDVPNQVGLSNVLNDFSLLDSALHETKIAGVWVLPSGPTVKNPGEALSSPRMRELVKELASRSDIVLLDSPPTLAAADAAALAPLVDGVLLVAAAGRATGRRVQRSFKQLNQVGAQVLGMVFSRAKAEDVGYTARAR